MPLWVIIFSLSVCVLNAAQSVQLGEGWPVTVCWGVSLVALLLAVLLSERDPYAS